MCAAFTHHLIFFVFRTRLKLVLYLHPTLAKRQLGSQGHSGVLAAAWVPQACPVSSLPVSAGDVQYPCPPSSSTSLGFCVTSSIPLHPLPCFATPLVSQCAP